MWPGPRCPPGVYIVTLCLFIISWTPWPRLSIRLLMTPTSRLRGIVKLNFMNTLLWLICPLSAPGTGHTGDTLTLRPGLYGAFMCLAKLIYPRGKQGSVCLCVFQIRGESTIHRNIGHNQVTNESVLKFMNKVGNCSYLMLSIVYICRMDDYEQCLAL